MTRIADTLREDVCTFMIISRSINVSDESCRENQNMHFMFNSLFFSIRDIYKIMCKNMAQSDKSHMAS